MNHLSFHLFNVIIQPNRESTLSSGQNKIKLDGSIKLNAILNESQRTNSMYVRVFVRYNSVRVQYILDVLTYKILQSWGHLGSERHIFNSKIKPFLVMVLHLLQQI